MLTIAALAILAAACSSSGVTDAAPPASFAATTTTTASSPATTVPGVGTTVTPTSLPGPTAPPVITTTPITGPGGNVTGSLVSVEGRGDATVRLPAAVGRPAIVHAQHDGTGRFEVSAVDAHGTSLGVVAQSAGAYSGTFPIGFVDETDRPTTALTVTTPDAWHLDIGAAALAPELTGAGVSGHGDTVLAYRGPAVSAHMSSPAPTPLTIHTYEQGVASVLVNTVGPYDARLTLPRGPAFISITATGDWSMSLG